MNNYTSLTVFDGEVLVYYVKGVSTFFQGDGLEVVGNVAVEAMKRQYLQQLETREGDEEQVVRNVAVEAMGGQYWQRMEKWDDQNNENCIECIHCTW